MRSSNICLERLLWLAAFAHTAWAVDPNRAMSQYIRDRWGVERGFPKGPVYAITQTEDGYLWVGTEAGLVRFDGMNFRVMQSGPRTPPLTSAMGLAPDRAGNLWVRVQYDNLLRYRDGVFDNPMQSLGYTNLTAMCRTNRGGLLASVAERGAFTYRDGRFELMADARALPRSPVISMAQTGSGEIWMGTRDAGLFRWNGGASMAVTKGLPDLKVNCLLPDGERGLWVGTDGGIARWNGSEIMPAGAGDALARTQVLAMAMDRDGNLWVGTDSRGLLRLNAHGAAPLDAPGTGSGYAVTAVFEDREGNLWLGSASGLERLRDSVFVTYSTSEGMPSRHNGAVYSDARNRTWFAPAEGGLYRLERAGATAIEAAGLAKDVVYSIAGKGDDLWIGRQRGGLTHLSAAGARTYTQADGLAQNSVFSVYLDRGGAVWAGTLTGGVSRFQDGKFATYSEASGMTSDSVAAILQATDGTMWFGTPKGLNALSGGRWRVYTARDGLPADAVNCVLEDSLGLLWAGTENGLAFRSGERFQTARGMDALREAIIGIAEDRAGWLWIATTNHVVRVKRDPLLKGALGAGDSREYGVADGLHGVEGVKRFRSVVADGLGRIWFSMDRGLSVVDPARVTGSSSPAMAHVQSVVADGVAVETGNGEMRIPAARQRVAFTFTGLNLSLPERIRFRYRLDGFDQDWGPPVTAREAVYTNLGPGPYRFHVMASNADGVWNGTEASLGFRIDALIWQTWWFRTGAVALCALTALGIYRLRLHQMASRLNVRFEERLDERMRIAKELHDTLLQGFVGASMQLTVASERLAGDSPVKAPVDRTLALMAQAIEEGRNAVRGLRLADTGADDLERAFSRLKQEFDGGDEVDFRVTVQGDRRALHPVVRDELYRLGREAAASAFRDASGGRIEMAMEYTRKRLRIVVSNNGKNAASHELQRAMRERAERVGARLSVRSNSGADTVVELTVPGHVAYGRQPRTEGSI